MFPAAVPEIPVSDLSEAIRYYTVNLGFSLDWHDEHSGIAGMSRDACRLFLTNGAFRQQYGNGNPVVIWINLDNKSAVDDLFLGWRQSGARLLSEPEDKPWKLREFSACDPAGNILRVFYDFRAEEEKTL